MGIELATEPDAMVKPPTTTAGTCLALTAVPAAASSKSGDDNFGDTASRQVLPHHTSHQVTEA